MTGTVPPPPAPQGATTCALHDGIDAQIRASGRPDLHPDGPTVTQDLIASDGMVDWQEAKIARTMLRDACWSDLPPVYGRYGSDATRALIDGLRALYGVPAAIVTDCGAAAAALVIDAVVQPGDHVLLARQIYGKTRAHLEWLAPRIGATIGLLDHLDAESLQAAVTPHTTLVIGETYSNPLMRAIDPDAVSDAIVSLRSTVAPGLVLAIDDTLTTPWGMVPPMVERPGIDLVFGAGTKALGGEDRDLVGYVVSHDIPRMNAVMDLQATRGSALSWRAASVLTEGLAQADRHHATRCARATSLATVLAGHPEVGEVFHPSRPDHPDADVIARAYARPGSLLSFRLADGDEAAHRHLCDVLAMTRTVRYALSFDGLVTKVNHHRTVSEHSTPPPRLRRQGIDRLVRVAAGVEDAEDLAAAFTWALDHHRAIPADDVQAWQASRRASLGLTA